MKPTFIHDCDSCKYMGSFTDRLGETHDFYYCPDSVLGGSYIARFGSEGSEYASMPGDVIESVYASLNMKGSMVLMAYNLRMRGLVK
jgi:hypothetical protein